MSAEQPSSPDLPPNSGRARWAILFLTCGGLFGQFFAFDIPSALNLQLGELLKPATGIDEAQYVYYFNMLYSVYSIPNAVLPLIMGIAVDRCGYRLMIVVLAVCVVGGQVLFAAGVYEASWPMMLAGRTLFGIGGESIQVAQNCMLFRWFKGAEVAFALGLNLSIARFGSVLNDVLTPWVSQHWGVMGSLGVGLGLCIFSCCCNALSAILDKSEGEKARLAEAANDEPVSPKDIFRLPKLYWLLVAYCLIVYCAILPFNNIASAFFVETFYPHLPLIDAQQHAGRAMAMLFMCAAIGTPPFGMVVDKLGMRATFLLLSSVLLTFSYSVIFSMPPMVSMLGLGIVYMVFAGAVWPAFALTVQQKELGTAYGVAVSLQNSGLAIMPFIVGYLQTLPAVGGHFANVIRLFMLLGVVSIVLAGQIYHTNFKTRGVLELPSSEAEQCATGGEQVALCAAKEKQLLQEKSSEYESAASAA